MGLIEPRRDKGLLSGQYRGLTAPGDDKVPSPHHKSLRTSSTPKLWRRKRTSPGRYRCANCVKPNPTGWHSWSQHASKTARRDNGEVPPCLGMISARPLANIINYIYNSNTPGTKMVFPRVDTAPQAVETPLTSVECFLGWGLEPVCGDSCPSGQR